MKHENYMSDSIGCLQVVRIYSFISEEIKVYKRASYIVFLFVTTENKNLITEIKHVLRAFIGWWKPRKGLWEFLRRDLLSNSPKRSLWFSPSYECMVNSFYFLHQDHKNILLFTVFLYCFLGTMEEAPWLSVEAAWLSGQSRGFEYGRPGFKSPTRTTEWICPRWSQGQIHHAL